MQREDAPDSWTGLTVSAIAPNHQQFAFGQGSELWEGNLRDSIDLHRYAGVHEANITHSIYSADGRWLVTASLDGTASIWRADRSRDFSVHEVLRHESAVDHAAFSPSGLQVVTCSRDGYVRVWDVASGMPVTGKLPHTGRFLCARIVGNRVVSASDEGVKQWPLPEVPAEWSEPLALLAEFIAGRTVDETSRATYLPLTESSKRWDSLKRWYTEQEHVPEIIEAYLLE